MTGRDDDYLVELNRRRFVQATGVGVAGLAAGGVPIAKGEDIWDDPEDVIDVLYLGGVEDGALHYSELLVQQLTEYFLERGIRTHYTERQDDLNPRTLENYDAVLLYGNRLEATEDQIDALEAFVEDGGGFVPVHSASASFTGDFGETPDDLAERYISLVGGAFDWHGDGEMTTDRVDHEIFDGVEEIEAHEETYRHYDLADDIEVLATGTGADYEDDESEPFTWTREQGDGQVFYTAWGHGIFTETGSADEAREEMNVWVEDGFKQLLENGIRWASGREDTIGDHPVLEELEYTNVEEYGHDEVPYYQEGVPERVSSNDDDTWDLVQDPLPVSESLAHTITPAEFEIEYFVSEEILPDGVEGQIMDMTFDDRGRCWLAVSKDYPNDAGEAQDSIVICEDTDGDGVADEFTVFKDEISIPLSLIAYRDGVLVSEVQSFDEDDGRVVYYGDEDGDDVADVEEELFIGFDTGDTHAGLNQLHYGQDNWIYGVVGYEGLEPDIDDDLSLNQDLFRFKPDGSEIEYVGSGMSNMAGVKTNEEGLVFCSSATAGNNVTTYAAIPAAYYDSVDGFDGTTTVDIRGEEHSRLEYDNRVLPVNDRYRMVDQQDGFTAVTDQEFYTAREFPEQYWNSTVFVGEGTANLLATFYVEQDGASYVSHNYHNLAASNDEWVSPTYANTGPDGMVWMIDFYNFVFQHNPTPGGYDNGPGNAYETNKRDDAHSRLYRVTTESGVDAHANDLSDADSEELVETLSDDVLFWRMTAQRKLVERGETDVVDDLIALIESEALDEIGLDPGAIHAIWTLDGLNALDDEDVLDEVHGALNHESTGARLNAVRSLPGTAETRDAILEHEVLYDEDDRVVMWALLKLGETPESDEAGAAVFEAIDDDERLEDELLVDAATVAAATHADGFIEAFGEVYDVYDGVDILSNGSFEAVEIPSPDGWSTQTFDGDAEYGYTDEESYTGERSIRIDSEEGTDAAWYIGGIEVEPETEYELSAMIKTEDVENIDDTGIFSGPVGACLNVEELNVIDDDIGVITDGVTGTEDWTEVSVEFNSGDNDELRINALLGAFGESSGTAWYDDISLAGPAGDECELVHEDPDELDHVPDDVDHVIFCDGDGDESDEESAFGGENLVPNGDLEAGDLVETPADWTVDFWEGDGEFALDSSEAFRGDYSVRIASENGLDGAWAQTVEVEPETEYTLRGRIKTEELDEGDSLGALFNVHEFGEDVATEAITGTEDWTQVEVTFDSGAYEELQINALFGGWGEATGTAWFDTVLLIGPEDEEEEEQELSENLLPNPTFEDGDAESADGWTTDNWSGELEHFRTDEESYAGDYCVGMTSEEGGDGAWSINGYQDIEDGEEYLFSAMVKTEDVEPAGGNGAVLFMGLQGETSEVITGTEDWTEVSIEYESTQESENVHLMHGLGGDATGTTYYDDVSLVQVLTEDEDPIEAIYQRVVEHLDYEEEDEDEVPDGAIEPGTTIEFDGSTAGWIGISPEEIEGEENPTLTLVEGEEYTVGWPEGDGGNHNIAIWDEDDEVVDALATGETSEPDEDQFLTFEATAEMAYYVCEPHAGSMCGEIDVVEE